MYAGRVWLRETISQCNAAVRCPIDSKASISLEKQRQQKKMVQGIKKSSGAKFCSIVIVTTVCFY